MHPLEVCYYGVNIAAKQLAIPVPEIKLIAKTELPNPTITAMYLPSLKCIILNEEWLMTTNWLEIVATCFHECRHAYQHHCIETASREEIATLQQWKREFAFYFQPTYRKNQVIDIDYLRQSIEIDAVAYAHYQMNVNFKVKTMIPEAINLAVIQRLTTFCKS
jgi:hypothetical protein